MTYVRRVFLIALALMLIAIPAMAQSGGAMLRFVHAIPGASAVDIYTDGQLTVANLSYGSASPYIDVPAGGHHIAVTQTGSDSPLWEQDINTGAGSALTLIAASAGEGAFQVYMDDLNALPVGKARFTAIHAVENGSGVDFILADGRPVIPGLQYNQPYGTLDLPATAYELAVVPAGMAVSDALVAAQPYKLNSGTSYVAIVYGTGDDVQTMLLSAPTQPELEGGSVRFAHVVPGAPEVDIYLNNVLTAPSLGFGEATGYIALPTGSYEVAARLPGSSSDIATATLDVSADRRATALIAGEAEQPDIQVIDDVVNAVNENTSVLTVMNMSTDATVSAAFSNGAALIGDVGSGNSDSTLLEPSDQGITVSAATGDAVSDQVLDLRGGIYGGVYYSAIVVDGADGASIIELPPVSLAQGTASAPGDATMAAPEPTLAPTEALPEPTLVPTGAAPTTEAPVAENPQPTATTAVEIIPQPTAIPTTTGPTARVLLDPGVNLQLRQYPNREAFSLGLAPSGAVLLVNGREGEPVPAVGTTATPLPEGAEAYVDPVTLLAEGEDLDPTLTWLNVTYDTPDGGAITAWVNALYLGVRDSQGRALPLRDLPTVPSNRAGSAHDTAIQPPSEREIITLAIVTNVDPGVRVHLRRVPSVQGESLALVPAGTQMELLGVNEDRDWVFVRFTAPQSTVTGWTSTNFVTFQRNNSAVDFARLELLGELNTISTDQRGSVVTSGQTGPTVAEDLRDVVAGEVVGLNPDANLHLRRYNNDQAESLALLPDGTMMVVTGRSTDDLWYQVTYQGQQGWVFSQYVELTFNGQPYEKETLPIIDTSTPTPTETPQG
ncbi:MAG: DUF4397 domain-containing protein [Anaerolineae bacterium]|nr:DUF4397 domain-containing protein [Anaerolineae bacterium]